MWHFHQKNYVIFSMYLEVAQSICRPSTEENKSMHNYHSLTLISYISVDSSPVSTDLLLSWCHHETLLKSVRLLGDSLIWRMVSRQTFLDLKIRNILLECRSLFAAKQECQAYCNTIPNLLQTCYMLHLTCFRAFSTAGFKHIETSYIGIGIVCNVKLLREKNE